MLHSKLKSKPTGFTRLNFSKKNFGGFTVVEMMVIAPIVILVIGSFIFAIVKMTGDVMSTRNANTLAYNIQDALNRIEDDARLSMGFLYSSINPTTPQGSDNGSTAFSATTTNKTIIINTFATTDNPLSSSRGLVYTNTPITNCNSPQISQNPPLMTNTVYFVSGDTLWRRVIMPSNYTNSCPPNAIWQKPSCAIGQIGSLCQTTDMKLVENIKDFSMDTAVPTTAAKITITATEKTANRDISGTIYASSPN